MRNIYLYTTSENKVFWAKMYTKVNLEILKEIDYFGA
jgi:hypothetical protein